MVQRRPQHVIEQDAPRPADGDHGDDGARPRRDERTDEARSRPGNGRTLPRVLTTGQVARLCNVAPRTVSKWFDLGQLRGYRIPGSRDRRIPAEQLLRFMKLHNMPLSGLDAGPRRVVLVLGDEDLARTIGGQLEQAGFRAHSARGGFQAGLLVERLRPHAVVLDAAGPEGLSAEIASAVRVEPHLAGVKLLALADPDPDPAAPVSRRGFDARLVRPFNLAQLIDTLHELTG